MALWQRNIDEETHDPTSASKSSESAEANSVELIHPFYLDTDMSMAFAAALSGGIALQTEDVETGGTKSDAVRNIQGSLKLLNILGVGGQRGSASSETTGIESRFVRQHTEASIFIALYNELRRTHQIKVFEFDELNAGDLVSVTLGPAVAPLRRVVDQIVRLLEVVAPLLGAEIGVQADPGEEATLSRQQRRQRQREAAKELMDSSSGPGELRQMYVMFTAIQEDLDQSGMIDVVVHREEEPSVILTLDKRFVDDQVLELIHTSKFTVIGKITEVWKEEDDVVNLYRRSVMSLVPALTQMSTWLMINFLASFASSIDVQEMQESAMAAAGVPPDSPTDPPDGAGNVGSDEVQLGDISALNPAVTSPAVQILPLAICA